MKRSLVPTYLLAGLLCGAGAVLLGSLLASLLGIEGLPAAPGRFLFSTFLWSSFFVPVYPIALAVLLLSRRFSPRRFGVLNLLLLPFVTVSLFHKVALHGSVPPSFLPDLLVASLGRFPASVLLFALIVLELLLVLSLRRPPEPPAEEEQEAKKAPRLRLPPPLEARRPEALAGGDGRRLKALEGPKRAEEDPEEAVELEEAAVPEAAQEPVPVEAIVVDAPDAEVEAPIGRAAPGVREAAPKLRPRREAAAPLPRRPHPPRLSRRLPAPRSLRRASTASPRKAC